MHDDHANDELYWSIALAILYHNPHIFLSSYRAFHCKIQSKTIAKKMWNYLCFGSQPNIKW